jgi:hypothetical protein
MGFRFFKRIKILPGVSLNLGKKGTSVSVGPKGAKVTIGSNGKVTTSVGIPGTGIYYRETVSGSKIRSCGNGSEIVIIDGDVKKRVPYATPGAMIFAKACGVFTILVAIVILCIQNLFNDNRPYLFVFPLILGIIPLWIYRKFKCEKCGAVDYPGMTVDGKKFCNHCLGEGNKEEVTEKKEVTAVVGKFTDGRDGQTYKTVTIDGKTWMAQNLNYKAEGSWCYNDDESNGNIYGRLYDWDTAKTACPVGWHLPTRQEWDDLVAYVGDREITDDCNFWVLPDNSHESDDANYLNKRDKLFAEAAKIIVKTGLCSISLLQRRLGIGFARTSRIIDQLEHAGVVGPSNGNRLREVLIKPEDMFAYISGSEIAGKKLKSKNGWNRCGNGTNDYDFSALPGGSRLSLGFFFDVGNYGNWWTSSEFGADLACYRYIYYYYDDVYEGHSYKNSGFSVRCVQD